MAGTAESGEKTEARKLLVNLANSWLLKCN
jgi:hypothetical protein